MATMQNAAHPVAVQQGSAIVMQGRAMAQQGAVHGQHMVSQGGVQGRALVQQGVVQAAVQGQHMVSQGGVQGRALVQQGVVQGYNVQAAGGAVVSVYRQAIPQVQVTGQQLSESANIVYCASKPHIVRFAGNAKDVLANIDMPDIEFDVSAAQKALGMASGAEEMMVGAMASGAKGAAGLCAVDILKVEIFRDFFQFLGIYFSSLSLPMGFQAFYGVVSSFASASFSTISIFAKAVSPIEWFWVFALIMFVGWMILARFMDFRKHIGLRIKSDRDQSKNWKEINRKDKKCKFNFIQKLLFLLISLYVPVTRNALDMVMCSPKYAYTKFQCVKDGVEGRVFFGSPVEHLDPKSCIAHYEFIPDNVNENRTLVDNGRNTIYPVAKAGFTTRVITPTSLPSGCYSDNHYFLVGISVVILYLYSIMFPKMLMDKVNT